MRILLSTLFICCAVGCIPEVPGGDAAGQEDNESDKTVLNDDESPQLADSAQLANKALAQDEESSNVSALIGPLAASSSAIVFTDGARAGEAFFNRTGGDVKCDGPCIAVFDAKCDGHSVYAQYTINSGSQKTVTNNSGCNMIVRFPLQTGSFNIAYRVCVSIPLLPDPCSGTVFDHN